MTLQALPLLTLVFLTACNGVQHSRFGVGAGAAITELGIRDETGAYGSIRGEIASTIDEDTDQVELGVRGLIGGRGVDFGRIGSPSVEVTTAAVDFGLEGLARLYANNADSAVRPYLEGFVGLAVQSLEIEASDRGISESVTETALSPTVGAAAGIEFVLADGFTLSIGGETRFNSYTFDDFAGVGDIDADYLDVGGFIMFGTRL